MLVSAGTRLPPDGTPEVFELKKKKGGGGNHVEEIGKEISTLNFLFFVRVCLKEKTKKKTLS